MRSVVDNFIDRILNDRRDRLRLTGLILLLALIVVGLVIWSLHYTGVAMTNEVYCGMEEHQHDDSCYTWELTCGLEESEGSEGHTHDNSCYETETELVCGLEETEGHTHDEACFDGDGNLICALPESEGHIHTDTCSETARVLVCGLEEAEADPGHTHTAICYAQVLTCGLEEHVHTMDCMTDETADLETARDWEATLPDDLTGSWNEDIVSVAESQLGYTESAANFRLAEDGVTRNGYTRYGEWYGNEYGNWDAMFAAFCLYYAGVTEDYLPYNAGAFAWSVALAEAGLYGDSDHTPIPGDLVFLDTDGGESADTVAVVSGILTDSNGEITAMIVIQGDHNDAVEEYTLEIDDGTILGYGVIPEQPADGTEEEPDVPAMTDGNTEAEEDSGSSGEMEESAAGGEAEEGSEASGEIEETAETAPEEPEGDAGTVSYNVAAPDTGTGGYVVLSENGDTGSSGGVLPLADDDEENTGNHEHTEGEGNGKGDVYIESIGGSVSWDADSGTFTGKIEITFDVNTEDLEEGKDGKIDQAELVLPSGITVPDDLLNNTEGFEGYIGTVGTSGTPAFRYWFETSTDSDGSVIYMIVIDFLDGYYDLPDDEVVYIEFEGSVTVIYDEETGSWTLGTEAEYPGGITIEPGQSSAPGADISTAKSGTWNSAEGTLDYTVTVSSSQGTQGQPITVTDTLTITGNIKVDGDIGDIAISAVDDNGQQVEIKASIETVGDGVYEITYTLPGLESAGGTYTITYSIPIVEDGTSLDVNGSGNNTVTATAEEGGGLGYDITDDSDSNVDVQYQVLSKTGAADTDGTVTWIITVNTGKGNIAGYILEDAQFADAVGGESGITVSPNDGYTFITDNEGNITGIGFTETEAGSGSNTNEYTITYTTGDNGTLGESDRKTNSVDFHKEDGEHYTTDTGVTEDFGGVSKSHVRSETVDGTYLIHWSSTITVPSGGIAAGTEITDSLGAWLGDETSYAPNQWFTYEQITSLLNDIYSGGLTFSLSGYDDVTVNANDLTIQVYDKTTGQWVDYSNLSSYPDDHFTAWKITIEKDVNFGGVYGYTISFDYTSTAEEASGEDTFYNRIRANDLYADAEDHRKTPVLKTDGSGNGTSSSVIVDDNGILTWIVEVYVPEGYDEYNFTVTDHLPAGLTLDSITVNGSALSSSDGTNWSGEVGAWDRLTGVWADYTVTASVTENNEGGTDVVVTIPQALAQVESDDGGAYIYITITAQIDQDDLAGLMDGDNEEVTSLEYTNSVSVKYGEDVYGSAEHTETATYEPPSEDKSLVSKTMDFNNEDNSKVVHYHVVLNPAREDLSATEDTLLFTDTARFGVWAGEGISLALDPTSVKFYEVEDMGAVTVKEDTTVDSLGYGTFITSDGEEIVYSADTADEVYVQAVSGDNGETYYEYFRIITPISVAWTYEYDGTEFTISGEIPDETAVLVLYDYNVRWTTGVTKSTDGFYINNTARLIGDEVWQGGSEESTQMGTVGTQGHTVEDSVQIYKVQRGNYGVLVPGTVFELYYWDADADDGAGDWEKVDIDPAYLTTGSNGNLNISKGFLTTQGYYFEDTAYYLVEAESAEGYVLNTTPYYFYWSSGSSVTISDVAGPDDFHTYNATDLTDIQYELYIENTPAPDEDIEVQKVWQIVGESDNEIIVTYPLTDENADDAEKEAALEEMEKYFPDGALEDLTATVELHYYLSSDVPAGWTGDLPTADSGSGVGYRIYRANGSSGAGAHLLGTISGDGVYIQITVPDGTSLEGKEVSLGNNHGTYLGYANAWGAVGDNGVTLELVTSSNPDSDATSFIFFISSDGVTGDIYIYPDSTGTWDDMTIEIVSDPNASSEDDGEEEGNSYPAGTILRFGCYPSDDNAYTYELNQENDWYVMIHDLPEYWIDSEGNVWWYYYYFKEVECSEGWTSSISTGTVVFEEDEGTGLWKITANEDGSVNSGVDGVGTDPDEVFVTNIMPINDEYELPSTGGAGLAPFYASGTVLLAAGFGIMISRKRRKEDKA